jgi:GTPase SAR1 family protein
MGSEISVEARQSFNRTVAFVGLDGAGKSSIAFQMVTSDKTNKHVPFSTPGVEYWELPMGGSSFRIYDCGRMGRYREQWTYFIKQSDGVSFVIDRTDKERMGRVRQEIADVITLCAAQKIPLLILVNKTDIKPKLTIRDFENSRLCGKSHAKSILFSQYLGNQQLSRIGLLTNMAEDPKD